MKWFKLQLRYDSPDRTILQHYLNNSLIAPLVDWGIFFVWNQQIQMVVSSTKICFQVYKISKLVLCSILFLTSFVSQSTIYEDSTVWLSGALLASTCILPSIMGNAPAQPHGVPAPSYKYDAKYVKINQTGIKITQSKKLAQHILQNLITPWQIWQLYLSENTPNAQGGINNKNYVSR